jgi:hypothetical protein
MLMFWTFEGIGYVKTSCRFIYLKQDKLQTHYFVFWMCWWHWWACLWQSLLVYYNSIVTLAKTFVHSSCQFKGCSTNNSITREIKATALYLKWVRFKLWSVKISSRFSNYEWKCYCLDRVLFLIGQCHHFPGLCPHHLVHPLVVQVYYCFWNMKKKKNKHPQYIQMYMKYDILCIENIIITCSLTRCTTWYFKKWI